MPIGVFSDKSRGVMWLQSACRCTLEPVGADYILQVPDLYASDFKGGPK